MGSVSRWGTSPLPRPGAYRILQVSTVAFPARYLMRHEGVNYFSRYITAAVLRKHYDGWQFRMLESMRDAVSWPIRWMAQIWQPEFRGLTTKGAIRNTFKARVQRKLAAESRSIQVRI